MVSIVIATYRRLEFLKLTVESMLNQTYSDFEIIIVGDGHQPDVEDYVSCLGTDKVRYYFVEHCGYPAKPRNFGIEKAKGEYIAFGDDDDLWEKEKLETQLTAMQANSQIVLSCTNRSIVNQNGEKVKEHVLCKHKHLGLLSLLVSNYITTSSVVVQKNILKETGLFPDTPIFKACEDYHLWIRVINCGKAFFVDKPFVAYRVHDASITTKFSTGAKRNLLLFKDVFSQIRVPFTYRCVAIIVAWMKFFYYKIRGI